MKNLYQADKRRDMMDFSSSASVDLTGLFEEVLNRGLLLRVKVTGRSMKPFLRGGEVLTIKKVPSSSLRMGDLIFFRNGQGNPVLHRIVRREKAGDAITVQTKGDAVRSPDEPISADAVLGKVFSIKKTRGHGKSKRIDMNSLSSTAINYVIVLAYLATANIRSAISVIWRPFATR